MISSIVDTGGKIVFLSSWTMGLIEWVGDIEFNPIFTGIMSLAGIVYIIVKITGGILDNKIKRKKLKENELE